MIAPMPSAVATRRKSDQRDLERLALAERIDELRDLLALLPDARLWRQIAPMVGDRNWQMTAATWRWGMMIRYRDRRSLVDDWPASYFYLQALAGL